MPRAGGLCAKDRRGRRPGGGSVLGPVQNRDAVQHRVAPTSRRPANKGGRDPDRRRTARAARAISIRSRWSPTSITVAGWSINEQFGPALPIIRYHDVAEVVPKPTTTRPALAARCGARDVERAKSIASRLECGSVWINKHGAIQPNAPFGGVKQSGIGVEFGDRRASRNSPRSRRSSADACRGAGEGGADVNRERAGKSERITTTSSSAAARRAASLADRLSQNRPHRVLLIESGQQPTRTSTSTFPRLSSR